MIETVIVLWALGTMYALWLALRLTAGLFRYYVLRIR